MVKFYEMLHDKKVVGLPARAVRKFKDFDFDSEMQMVEMWPIIQAYGLDIVGNGFFTMKHKYQNIKG